MALRRFAFTVTISDRDGYLVSTVGGNSNVPDDNQTQAQISQSIVDDLPRHLRQDGYQFSVILTAL